MNCLRKTIIKALTYVMGIDLIGWLSCLDGIHSWQPVALMLVEFGWIVLVLYANLDWIVERMTYYEKM